MTPPKKGFTLVAEPEISTKLAEWARRSRLFLSTEVDGRPLFWANSGENQYFIGVDESGWYIVTTSDRYAPEIFNFAAPKLETVEKKFFMSCGLAIRYALKLPRVAVRLNSNQLPPGFSLGLTRFYGKDRFSLTGPDGKIVAIGMGATGADTSMLVRIALVLNASVDDIMASWLDPEGKPLFTLEVDN